MAGGYRNQAALGPPDWWMEKYRRMLNREPGDTALFGHGPAIRRLVAAARWPEPPRPIIRDDVHARFVSVLARSVKP